MPTLISVIGNKGGSAKTTTAFLLGWYLTHCTEFEARWVDLDVRTASLTKIVDTRQRNGYKIPELAFSALTDSTGPDPASVDRAFRDFLQRERHQAGVWVIDTPRDPTFPATRTALQYSGIIVIPALMTLPVVTEVIQLASLLANHLANDISSGKRRVFVLPVGKSKGAVTSANEKISEKILDHIDSPIIRLDPIPRSENIPLSIWNGLYPSELSDTRYRSERGAQLHQVICQSFCPIKEELMKDVERAKRRSVSAEKRKRKTGGRVSGRKRSYEIEPVDEDLEEGGLIKNPRLTITIPGRARILLKAYRMRHRKRYNELMQRIKEDIIMTMERACKEDPVLQEIYKQFITINKLSGGRG